MKCPNCQTELPENAKFCMTCGKTLQAEIVCSRCAYASPLIAKFCLQCGQPLTQTPTPAPATPQPTSFVNGRYKVKKFLGEGGKKKVYLAHDNVLDRDVAFALIKTEKLDAANRTEAVARARELGLL